MTFHGHPGKIQLMGPVFCENDALSGDLEVSPGVRSGRKSTGLVIRATWV